MSARLRHGLSWLALFSSVGCTSSPSAPAGHEHGAIHADSGPEPAPMTAAPHDHDHDADAGRMAGEPSAPSGAVPPGYAPVPLREGMAARLNLTKGAVEERALKRTLRTVGAVTVDETRSSHVHTKVRGWIEEIYVDFTGQHVRKGTPLCAIYSPEILSAELELLAILDRAPGGESQGAFADIERRARAVTLDAARRRLELWDVPPSSIQKLEETREPFKAFPLLAPRSGTVVAKQALAGSYVDASTELYLVSDLSRVWVLVDIYAADLPFVKVGDTARLAIEGTGPTPLEARVTFLDPTVDEPTRTVKVRFELDNRSGRLRPGAFVTAEMDLDAGRGLSVPEEAVIRTGARNIVFVVEPDRVDPREVTLGPSAGGYYRVLSGLRAGEQVATNAQFLLDSESRIRATSSPGPAHAH